LKTLQLIHCCLDLFLQFTETGFGGDGVSIGPPFPTAGGNNGWMMGCEVCAISATFDKAEGGAVVELEMFAGAAIFAIDGAVCDNADTARSRLVESVI
jgi:hypothetical protein